jgi:uncharacterized lipoprotein YddW (UPF0748 family)
MKKNFLLFIFVPLVLFAQPKEELRAVWLTTAFGLDWPKCYDEAVQQQEIINILDKLKEANFNTVMLQVRARGDLIYPSNFEPWAKALTDQLGKNPGYDPLKFIINEAHKRGIEIHAWMNVYKVYGKGYPIKTKPEHVILKYPNLCSEYHDEWWMDPGNPQTRNYLLNVFMELVRNYDIDGIHLDYLRYPNKDFNDNVTYAEFGKGDNKSDWRRNNITQFVEALYDSIQSVKPMIKLGCAPVGIYKNTLNFNGWEAYYDTYQDPVKWINDKKIDYVSPQTYWKIEAAPHYDLVVRDWNKIIDGRFIYPGIALFRLAEYNTGWHSNEILAQVDILRSLNIKGEVFFRTDDLVNNIENILTLIRQEKYTYPANIPPMPWKDNIRPLPPKGLTSFQLTNDYLELYWTSPARAVDGDTAKYFNIYASKKYPVNISNSQNFLVYRLPATGDMITLDVSSMPEGKYYAVMTTLDKGNNESNPSNTITFTIEAEKKPVTIAKGQTE